MKAKTAIFLITPLLIAGRCTAQTQTKTPKISAPVQAIFDSVKRDKLDVQRRYQAYREAYKLALKLKDTQGQLVAVSSLSIVDTLMGQEQEGNAWQLSLQKIAHQAGNRQAEAYALREIGIYQDRWFEPKQAEMSYREALEIETGLGDRKQQAATLFLLNFPLGYQGRVKAAQEAARKGLQLARQSGDGLRESRILNLLSSGAQSLGQLAESRNFANQSNEKSFMVGDPIEQAQCAVDLASCDSIENRMTDAQTQLKRAATLVANIEHSGMRSGIFYVYGLARARSGQYSEAISSLEQALNINLAEHQTRSLSSDSALLGKVLWLGGHKFEGGSVEGLGLLGRIEIGGAERGSGSLWELAAMNDSIGDTGRAIPEMKFALNVLIHKHAEDDALTRIQIRHFPALDSDGFQLLSSWLVKAGRRTEAAEVRTAGAAWWAGRKAHEISLSPSEKQWKTQYESLAIQYRPISIATDLLLDVVPKYLSSSQRAELARLEQQSEQMAQGVLTFALNPKIGRLPAKPKNGR